MKVLNCMSSFISLPAIIQRILQVCICTASPNFTNLKYTVSDFFCFAKTCALHPLKFQLFSVVHFQLLVNDVGSYKNTWAAELKHTSGGILQVSHVLQKKTSVTFNI